MNGAAVAGLPMYDFPGLRSAHDALWAALAARLAAAGVRDVPAHLAREFGHFALWQHPALLLGQACEYPLAGRFRDTVRWVATPRYTATGCVGAAYRSAIVVRRQDAAARLEDMRQRRCVINERDSNSGMNLLRAAVAPLAGGAPFFSSVICSGSHRASVAMVAASEADVAAIDCVSFAHFGRLQPASVAGLRILDWTPASPCLPYITSRTTDPRMLETLRGCLAATLADASMAGVCATLMLAGVEFEPAATYATVLALEKGAIALGYPRLC